MLVGHVHRAVDDGLKVAAGSLRFAPSCPPTVLTEPFTSRTHDHCGEKTQRVRVTGHGDPGQIQRKPNQNHDNPGAQHSDPRPTSHLPTPGCCRLRARTYQATPQPTVMMIKVGASAAMAHVRGSPRPVQARCPRAASDLRRLEPLSTCVPPSTRQGRTFPPNGCVLITVSAGATTPAKPHGNAAARQSRGRRFRSMLTSLGNAVKKYPRRCDGEPGCRTSLIVRSCTMSCPPGIRSRRASVNADARSPRRPWPGAREPGLGGRASMPVRTSNNCPESPFSDTETAPRHCDCGESGLATGRGVGVVVGRPCVAGCRCSGTRPGAFRGPRAGWGLRRLAGGSGRAAPGSGSPPSWFRTGRCGRRGPRGSQDPQSDWVLRPVRAPPPPVRRHRRASDRDR